MVQLSDDLIHFPKLDPGPISEKTAERSKLQQDIDAFLAKGGVITECDATMCVHYPIRRTRAAQINFVKERAYARTMMRQKKP